MQLRSSLLTALLVCVLLPLAQAQQAKTGKKEATKPSSVEVSGPSSGLSRNISSAVSAKLPKYQAPEPEAPRVERAADPTIPDLGDEEALPEDKPLDPDQPMNKIIRLPRYVVEGDRPPVFKEHEIYTKSALARIAMERYLSRFDSKVLNRFTLPIIGISAEQRAMMIYEEEKRLQDKEDIERMAKSARMSGDKVESEYLKRESDKTFLRSQGMDWSFPKN